MKSSLDWYTYDKIHDSKKELNSYNIKCAQYNDQQYYHGKSCLDTAPEKGFTIIQCRKGHRAPHLSYTLFRGCIPCHNENRFLW